jgi:hypothetical protein
LLRPFFISPPHANLGYLSDFANKKGPSGPVFERTTCRDGCQAIVAVRSPSTITNFAAISPDTPVWCRAK